MSSYYSLLIQNCLCLQQKIEDERIPHLAQLNLPETDPEPCSVHSIPSSPIPPERTNPPPQKTMLTFLVTHS